MNKLDTLLAITDFSEHATHAAHRAAAIAAQCQARLELLHVISGSSLQTLKTMFGIKPEHEDRLIADANGRLRQLADALAEETGIHASTRVAVGAVLEEALAAAANADLMVLGARGLSPLRDATIGTLAARLIGKCTLPILMVNQPCSGRYQRVLAPVDFSAHSLAALDLGGRLAPDAGITVLHAYEVPFESNLRLAGVDLEIIEQYRAKARGQSLQKLRGLIGKSGIATPRLTFTVEHGDAALTILDEARENHADLIVIGKHGQSLMEELLLGSVTRHILADACCDVLVAHA